jgi:ribosomal protein S18 acetylase RimI-like enzyme
MIKIRKAAIEEIDEIEGLYTDLKATENEKYGQACSAHWSFAQQDQKYFGDRIIDKNGIVLVVETEDGLAGFICGFVSRQKDKQDRIFVKVENIYVSSVLRGEGVGGRLIKAFEEVSKEKGAEVIKVSPIIENQGAIGFYEHKGFRRSAIVLEKKLEE